MSPELPAVGVSNRVSASVTARSSPGSGSQLPLWASAATEITNELSG